MLIFVDAFFLSCNLLDRVLVFVVFPNEIKNYRGLLSGLAGSCQEIQACGFLPRNPGLRVLAKKSMLVCSFQETQDIGNLGKISKVSGKVLESC